MAWSSGRRGFFVTGLDVHIVAYVLFISISTYICIFFLQLLPHLVPHQYLVRVFNFDTDPSLRTYVHFMDVGNVAAGRGLVWGISTVAFSVIYVSSRVSYLDDLLVPFGISIGFYF